MDATGPTIVVELTSRLTTPTSLRDVAWKVTEQLVAFWDLDTVSRIPNAVPALRLVLNRTTLECSVNVMVEVGYGQATRDQWATECVGLA